MALVKSKFSYDKNSVQNNEEQQIKPKLGHGDCVVYGCGRQGHIHTGQWNCRYHYNVHGDNLQNVTNALRRNEHLVNWFEKINAANEVQWLFGLVKYELPMKNRCPADCQPLEGEKFIAYRERIKTKLWDLLNLKHSAPEIEYKSAAVHDYPVEEF
jgi:hypothetical protein